MWATNVLDNNLVELLSHKCWGVFVINEKEIAFWLHYLYEVSSWGLCRATYTICRGAISVGYRPPIGTLMSSYCSSPPNLQGVRSPQPVHAVHSPYCRVLVRVPLWECVHGDGKCRTWSIYHGNRVQYPHCCSITMVIRMQYSIVLRTYVRTAQCRAWKKNYTTRCTYVRTWVLEY